MIEANLKLPLFPLSAHILPGGRMRLKIFEPRYVRMVKTACAEQSGFGICMHNNRPDKLRDIHPIGTYVSVVDFDMLDDGMLGITVEGHRCFQVAGVQVESDKLMVGQCQWLDDWPNELPKDQFELINSRLRDVFDNYPDLKNLYTHPKFNDPNWVIYRWLELVPVKAEEKQQLIQHKDCSKAFDFLSQLVE